MEETDLSKIIDLAGGNIQEKVASEIISQIFKDKNDFGEIVSEAVEEVCKRIIKAIDNAFMKEYIAGTNSVATLLWAYNETKDKNTREVNINKLSDLHSESTHLMDNLKRFDELEGIFACFYISNLNIICIKALSEYNSDYNKVLVRIGKEYAEWAEKASKRIIELTEESVGGIYSFSLNSTTNPPDIGNVYSGYFIKKIDILNIVILQFYTCYEDKWEVSKNFEKRHKFILSEEIKLDVLHYYEDFRNLYLTKIGEDSLKEKYINFFEQAKDYRNEFLQSRLSYINSLNLTISKSCYSWRLIN
ncbi:hypothetical protein PMY56_16035 [Clostridium tertium]|jgi:hypothetical protein|nr:MULTISPECIES: hypothetical protein [Clostridium]EEH97758.1 hypothetical protein CSBG_01384 [Clostridium sp. 7_2_43FAA]MBS5308599.1 hypothetical protein [Clostridium sp.]MBU6135293.1 hypothetical protein [Clostridium tertium]MDB1923497.1 hypothetical protein [Clostridium tertium]MDB1927644.1 hypothetical protein [Clostridium tertium]